MEHDLFFITIMSVMLISRMTQCIYALMIAIFHHNLSDDKTFIMENSSTNPMIFLNFVNSDDGNFVNNSSGGADEH